MEMTELLENILKFRRTFPDPFRCEENNRSYSLKLDVFNYRALI